MIVSIHLAHTLLCIRAIGATANKRYARISDAIFSEIDDSLHQMPLVRSEVIRAATVQVQTLQNAMVSLIIQTHG
jgi:ribosomal protein L14